MLKICKTKRAIILAGAPTLWEDFLSIRHLLDSSDVITVNHSGCFYSGIIKFWVTLHPEKFAKWKDTRKKMGYDMSFISVGYGRPHNVPIGMDFYADFWRGSNKNTSSGTSSLFAVKIALEAGYNKVILCGAPLEDDSCHALKPCGDEYTSYRDAWIANLPKMKGKVVSLSGWTKTLLQH